MTRRSRRSSGSIFDVAEEFQHYPIFLALISALGVIVVLEVILPAVIHANPTKSPAGIDYAALFLPLVQVMGWFFSGAILLFGLIGVGSRWLDRKRDAARFERQTDLESIRRLSWQEFERLLGELYRRQGYDVRQRGGPVADGGADIELRRDGEKLLVQAKHWRFRLVRLPQVRELWGAVADEHADGGILITSGSFTNDARLWTSGKNLTLVNGQELAKAMASIQGGSASASIASSAGTRVCKECGRPMVQRMARRGPSAGQPFWGCTGYPQCRHTEPISSVAISG